MIVPVILAGGKGTRLWPLSRNLLPKQFIQFPNLPATLFENTLTRLQGLQDLAPPLIVCNEEHRFLVAEQLRHSGIEKNGRILLEPFGRNTAPAVAIAALAAMSQDKDATLLVLPADHIILDIDALHVSISAAASLAADNKLVTFGIVPDVPETGYGYIKQGESLGNGNKVSRFVEKPDLETAKSYLSQGDYLWNSGMFMFKASAYLNEMKNHAPAMLQCCEVAFAGIQWDPDYGRISAALFESCPSDSIDYAVMEKSDQVAVVALDAGWNDLGAWSALWEVADRDADNNMASGDVVLQDVSGSYIHASSRLVTAIGIDDAVIVETSDAVLVASRDKVQDVKLIVETLLSSNRAECDHHNLVVRPWGSYESLMSGKGFQVKHIVVKPGAALSLQMHNHRAEHWTVVHGTAKVTRDVELLELKPNESVFLPLGCKHRLENPGQENVEIIEVQVGDYLGEDDIVRFDDIYGRVEE